MKKTVKILSIDGGGIRGIIPAVILSEVERRTGRKVNELFDVIAGTSTGGVIALGLTKPGSDKSSPEYSAADLVRLYETEGSKIFSRSLLYRIGSLNGIANSKYPATQITEVFNDYFGETKMVDALSELVIPSYDIERRAPFFFKRKYAKSQPKYNFLMRDVALATTAAPTYFKPTKVPTQDTSDYFALVDGGVFANNPTLAALSEARTVYQHTEQFFVVSLGTGVVTNPILHKKAKDWGLIGWARPMLDIVLNGISDSIDHHLSHILRRNSAGERMYYRFQTKLSRETVGLDNADPDNIRILKLIAESIIRERSGHIDELCERLVEKS
jgi:patatin-like phospholipase/acyl hydrolase